MRYETRNIYSITLGNVHDESGNVIYNGETHEPPFNPLSTELTVRPVGVTGTTLRTVNSNNTITEGSITESVSVEYPYETASLMVYDRDAETLATSCLHSAELLPQNTQRLSSLSFDASTGEVSVYDSSETKLSDSYVLPVAALLRQSEIIRIMSALALNATTY